jgi:hypothetical protein
MRNPLTLEAFAEWCEKQPADAEYNYEDPNRCAYCQYLRATGFDVRSVGPTYWTEGVGHKEHPLICGLNDALNPGYPDYGKWTFGALVSRLRARQE